MAETEASQRAGADALAFAGAARQAEMVRAGEVSPKELVELCLERIKGLDSQLNAFRTVLAESALAEAEQAEERRSAGEEAPLLGVPVAIKDSVDVAGELTTHGTNAFPDPAPEDAEMVRRLREAGAIVIGKTNLPELAICGFTESETWGISRNPWNVDRSPGGSSGGSAAAVAAGMVPLASASDGGGSIRIPAASCGVFGLKPQRGRISIAPDLRNWRGLSVNGCEARSVLDAALYLDVTSGGSKEPGAPADPEVPFVDAAQTAPGKLRIAWSVKPPRAALPATVDDVATGAVAATAALLGSLGHEVAQQDPDWGTIGNHMTPRYLRGISDDIDNVALPERLEKRTRGFGRLGHLIPERQARKAQQAEKADWERIGKLFERFDVLMTPVMGGTAIPVRRWEGQGALRTVLGMSRFYPFCIPWNHMGNPAASVPAGFAKDGMPTAVQIIGRPGDEATLLSLAGQLEAERPWADRHPTIS